MSQSSVEALIARWMEDEVFRERLRAAPVETAAAEGYDLTEEERAALAVVDFSASDEQLRASANFA